MFRSSVRFVDRVDAGRRLAALVLAGLRAGAQDHAGTSAETGDRAGPVVLALPRGGVIVAREVAAILRAPLDVLVVRKIGAPFNAEFGVGAITEDDVVFLDERALKRAGISRDAIDPVVESERLEVARRVKRYRGDRARVALNQRQVVLVDDGLATGVTAIAAARSVRKHDAQEIVLAVPVAAPQSVASLEAEVDRVIAFSQPDGFSAVGSWYQDFRQTSDEEVVNVLSPEA